MTRQETGSERELGFAWEGPADCMVRLTFLILSGLLRSEAFRSRKAMRSGTPPCAFRAALDCRSPRTWISAMGDRGGDA